MSLGPVVDIAIGLIFIYLLLGLLTTALQEAGAGALKLRGKQLKTAISGLIADGNKAAPLFEQVFGHPLIGGAAATTLPSYVPSRNFALAVIDTLSSGSQGTAFSQIENGIGQMPPGSARDALVFFIKDAGGDLDKLKASLATWYDDAMDRLSGVYKRYSQLFAVVVGLVLAVGLNIDSINIANTLWTQDALRAKLADAAQAYSDKNASVPTASAADSFQQLRDLPLPIGWDNSVGAAPSEKRAWIATVYHYLLDKGWTGRLLVIIGWLITGLATSLGAPFWFDTLKNVLSIRGAGPKPPRADGAAS